MALHGRPRGGIDSGNRTGNPLRPLRMAMLQHGFVDQHTRAGFKPDEADPLSYGIVKIRGRSFPTAAAITLAIILLVILLAVVVF